MDYGTKAEKMALTEPQIKVLQLLTSRRKEEASYFAGGAALNLLLKADRKSHDLDLFHDSTEALQATWNCDRAVLESNGYTIEILREVVSFVEADVCSGEDHVRIQWVRDSAFRFFPLITDAVFGMMLHPFDLATNKVLALASRLEPRDWLDTIECHKRMQPLGFLMWAACGKDPGINPEMLASDAARLHYSQLEIDMHDFEGPAPSAQHLGILWKDAVASAKNLIELLPEEHSGECLLAENGELYNGAPGQVSEDLEAGKIIFHKGSIKGAWPVVIGE